MSVTRTLHHFPLDPASRQARLALAEKRIPFEEKIVRFWERPAHFEALNPSGYTPVLVEEGSGAPIAICEVRAILEHLEEAFPEPSLLGEGAAERAETRRLLSWFDRKFDVEVNALLLHEKLEKRLLKLGAPDLSNMRNGREALREHLAYLERLLDERNWLAGSRLSLGDFAAAAHVSVIDFFGDVPWRDFPAVTAWYMKMKSRPAFRPLLADRWPGLAPAATYADLDF
ncbi:MAG: glutathione S-transferase family protein [Caulobacteraceae bacterium]